MRTGTLYGVGLGPGAPDLLTRRAETVLRSADVIFTVEGPNSGKSVSGEIVDSLGDLHGERKGLLFSMSLDPDERLVAVKRNAQVIVTDIEHGLNCAVAIIGDPAIYSTFGYILKVFKAEYPHVPIEIIPGITSFSALAAEGRFILVEDEETLQVLPCHNGNEILPSPPNSCTVYLKAYKKRNRLLGRILDAGADQILYGAKIGLDDQKIARVPGEIADAPEEYLSLLIAKYPGADREP